MLICGSRVRGEMFPEQGERRDGTGVAEMNHEKQARTEAEF